MRLMGMSKKTHEICCPVHVFIQFNSDEKKVIDSPPLQRLKHIHQLALTYLVFPGATHKRFEHSLGVMELASRMFDVVTNPNNLHKKIKNIIRGEDLPYWRKVLRMAALCHDVGHLPFSHSAEKELLPGSSHEEMAAKIIKGKLMENIWKNITPPLKSEHIVKLALGPKELSKIPDIKLSAWTDWETILSELIVSDVFGADRMDYLLRDSYYCGVQYGKFDHYRLIDCLRILPSEHIESEEPILGIEGGGVCAAEALLLARYFMFSTVYFHPIRRIYDIHLKDFLKVFFGKGFPTKIDRFLKWTDNEIMVKIMASARKGSGLKHEIGDLIVNRKHYKLLYVPNPKDIKNKKNFDPLQAVFKALCKKFGEEKIRKDSYKLEGDKKDFPIVNKDGRISSSLATSHVLNHIPPTKAEYIFASRDIFDTIEKWLKKERVNILKKGD